MPSTDNPLHRYQPEDPPTLSANVTAPFPGQPGVFLSSVDMDDGVLKAEARATADGANYPVCDGRSDQVHSSCPSFPVGMPTAGQGVVVSLRVRSGGGRAGRGEERRSPALGRGGFAQAAWRVLRRRTVTAVPPPATISAAAAP
ncbi:hypothetical protein ACFWJS_40710, partial [Streptomyces sp. NPDC127061]